MTQPHAVRRQRAADRNTRHAALRALLGQLGHFGHLSPADIDRLRDCVLTDLAETEDLRRTISGQTRAVDEMAGRLAAADQAIREVEQERDTAETAIARVRALHAPGRDWSWKPFGCEHHGAHDQPCAHCGVCSPCPTLRALDGTT